MLVQNNNSLDIVYMRFFAKFPLVLEFFWTTKKLLGGLLALLLDDQSYLEIFLNIFHWQSVWNNQGPIAGKDNLQEYLQNALFSDKWYYNIHKNLNMKKILCPKLKTF